MAAANVQPLIDNVRNVHGVLESAKAWFDGQEARLEAVKAEALARGATEQELAPLTEEIALTHAKAAEVAAAIAANA
jgi:hypothetical protein